MTNQKKQKEILTKVLTLAKKKYLESAEAESEKGKSALETNLEKELNQI